MNMCKAVCQATENEAVSKCVQLNVGPDVKRKCITTARDDNKKCVLTCSSPPANVPASCIRACEGDCALAEKKDVANCEENFLGSLYEADLKRCMERSSATKGLCNRSCRLSMLGGREA